MAVLVLVQDMADSCVLDSQSCVRRSEGKDKEDMDKCRPALAGTDGQRPRAEERAGGSRKARGEAK